MRKTIEQLKKMPLWLLYRKTSRGGKIAKIPFAADGQFSRDVLIERINSDLVNILGNLVNRTVSMNKKYFDAVVQEHNVSEELDKDLIDSVLDLGNKVTAKM